jgi:hypothetical protein
MHMIPGCLSQNWWTEAHAAWAEAFALILIFGLELILAYFTLREHKEARHERRQAEIARQRSDVTCAGVTSILRALPEEQLCQHLWAGHFRHAGFAFEKNLYGQLPEYLRRKAEPFRGEIEKPIQLDQHKIARFLLVFRFPYPAFDAVLADVNRLNFGNIHLVWDDSGRPITVPRN